MHRQLRALTILDFLIQNAGDNFLRNFADEALLERLRVAGADTLSHRDVREKCRQLFAQWAVSFKGQPGMEGVTSLYRQLPRRKQPTSVQQSSASRDSEFLDPDLGPNFSVSAGDGPSTVLGQQRQASSTHKSDPVKLTPSSRFSSSVTKKHKEKHRKFNVEKEKPRMLETIAASSVASTNLMNALRLVNREHQQVSDNPEVCKRFELCKELRYQILWYIQLVNSEDFLGSLIHANEELVAALRAFEILDKSIGADSDSEEAGASIPQLSPLPPAVRQSTASQLAGLSLDDTPPPKPPRPNGSTLRSSSTGHELESESEENEDDPFGDKNAISTPAVERTSFLD